MLEPRIKHGGLCFLSLFACLSVGVVKARVVTRSLLTFHKRKPEAQAPSTPPPTKRKNPKAKAAPKGSPKPSADLGKPKAAPKGAPKSKAKPKAKV